MINSLKDLAIFMKLPFLKKIYPTPHYGNGEDVAEISEAYSWQCVRQAALALSDEKLRTVLLCKFKITFHNNSNNGHTSVGATWTIKQFLKSNGGSELRKRIENLDLK